MWDPSSPTRDQTPVPCTRRQIRDHWTTRVVPRLCVSWGIKTRTTPSILAVRWHPSTMSSRISSFGFQGPVMASILIPITPISPSKTLDSTATHSVPSWSLEDILCSEKRFHNWPLPNDHEWTWSRRSEGSICKRGDSARPSLFQITEKLAKCGHVMTWKLTCCLFAQLKPHSSP